MKKYKIKGRFLPALDIYDALYIKTDGGKEICINEFFHNNIKKDAKISIIVKVLEG